MTQQVDVPGIVTGYYIIYMYILRSPAQTVQNYSSFLSREQKKLLLLVLNSDGMIYNNFILVGNVPSICNLVP